MRREEWRRSFPCVPPLAWEEPVCQSGSVSIQPRKFGARHAISTLIGAVLAVTHIILYPPEHDFSKLEALALIALYVAGVMGIWDLIKATWRHGDVAAERSDFVVFICGLAAGWIEWLTFSEFWPDWWRNAWPILMLINALAAPALYQHLFGRGKPLA